VFSDSGYCVEKFEKNAIVPRYTILYQVLSNSGYFRAIAV